MKLTRYNKETLPSRIAVATPYIRINDKGSIVINKAASELLKLGGGSTIELVQNAEAPKEWFAVVGTGDPGLPVRENKGQAGYMFQSSVLAATVIRSIDPSQSIICMNFGKEPLEHDEELLWPIITPSYQKYLKPKK